MDLMSEQAVKDLLMKCGAICEGHFVFTKKEIPPGSGKWAYFHGDTYVNKDQAYWLPSNLAVLANEIAKRLVGRRIDVIVGPEKGAIGLAPLVALALTEIQHKELLPPWGEVAACFAEKVGEEAMAIKRVFSEHLKDNPLNLWVAEDIGNSGSSARKTVRAIKDIGSIPVGVSFLAARRIITPDDMDGVPVEWLTLVEGEMWPEDDCPLCKEDGFESVSLTAGKGQDFLKRKGIL